MKFNRLVNIFLFIIPFCTFCQNEYVDYTSSFAKLQSNLSDELGVKSIRTIVFDSDNLKIKPYSLQIIGNTNYNSFLEAKGLYKDIRIIYIDDIDFSNLNTLIFNELKNLKAIRFKNCKNINFNELNNSLSESENLEQIHFNGIKFDKWRLNFNKLTNLKVITLDDCLLENFSKLELNLEEFSINNFRNTIDLKGLGIREVKNVNITESVIKKFPFNLSNSHNLEYLNLKGSKIKKRICKNISGFRSLLYFNITNLKANFNSVKFSDNEDVLIINGDSVTSGSL